MPVLRVANILEVTEAGQKIEIPAPDPASHSPEYLAMCCLILQFDQFLSFARSADRRVKNHDPQAMMEDAMKTAASLVEGMMGGKNGGAS
jgi:hypothetical protein